jgi:hypothetical protein
LEEVGGATRSREQHGDLRRRGGGLPGVSRGREPTLAGARGTGARCEVEAGCGVVFRRRKRREGVGEFNIGGGENLEIFLGFSSPIFSSSSTFLFYTLSGKTLLFYLYKSF